MISVSLNLRNPWSQQFKNLWSKAYPTPHPSKYIELEVYKDSSLLSINFSWTMRTSHAGLDFDFGLFGYCLHFQFYDIRHWNYTEGRWMFYTEEEGLH